MTLRLFPSLPGIVYPVKRSPLWSTDVQTSVSGKKTTLPHWSYPVYAFEVGYEFLRTDAAYREYQDLLAFYNLANGRANLFRFNDPDDNAVTAQGIGVGDGATTQFQLVRSVGGTSFAWVDPVFYPTGTPQIFVDGVLQTTPGDYSIGTTGLVTFVVAPANGKAVTWTGTYDWLVRFGEDSSTFEQFTYNLQELKKLTFQTEKI